jgi:hypothetical protein
VERVISQLASRGGRRLKLRYLDTPNNNAWLKRRSAALNLRNLIGRGLTRRDGTWALATTQGSGVLSDWPVRDVTSVGVEQPRTCGIMRFAQPHDRDGRPCLPTHHP